MSSRYLVVPRTLCFVFYEDEVLLIKRAANRRIFPNKINGLGGHVERDEDVYSSAAREIREEAGIEVQDLWLAGVVNIDGVAGQVDVVTGDGIPGVMLFVFTAVARDKEVCSSEEGKLFWAKLTAVSELAWVDGDPGLLERSLQARAERRMFFG